ncbi:MAG TPA: porin [Thermodesulfovibrionales bacterium]|nr:porin [Thermodesulfovibrionales bacterium]
MKRLCVFLLLFVFSLSVWILPVMASDPSMEIEQLKKDMQRLLDEQMILKNRIEELEKTQVQTETKTTETGKKVVEAEKKGIQTGYDKGFYIKSPDDNFFLKTNLFLQFRYTYLDFDRTVNANDEDWNNFFVRRARVVFSGNAPNKDWTYFFHIQLEPTSAVNLHDAYVTWKKYPYAQVQFGRSKLPYGLHFWQSAIYLNGIERSIFSGETDVDGKEDSRKWPGGNANFQVNNEDTVTKYPVGGFHLFRSQGVQLQGDIDMFGQNGFLQYWTGVYNGRNTKGGINIDSTPILVGRISINPFGKYNLLQQGDIDYSKIPKVCFLVSGFHNTDRLSQTRSSTGGTVTVDPYDVKGSGYDLAALFRYKGFSADAEYGYDRFEQDREGGNTWDRFAYRLDAGYFLIPKKFEVVARYAYVERLKDNNVERSLASGLGLVSVNGGTNNAIEDNLREYTAGLNYYFYGHNLKFFVDYSYLTREFIEVPGATDSAEDQHDDRYRAMMQFYF